MLPSIGHLVVILLYLTINLIITFTNFDNDNLPLLSNIASRTGWSVHSFFSLDLMLIYV